MTGYPVVAAVTVVLLAVQLLVVLTGIGGDRFVEDLNRYGAPAAATSAAIGCLVAAWRGGLARRGWVLFAIAAGAWAFHDGVAVAIDLAGSVRLEFPSVLDIPGMAALVFAGAAMLAFLRPALSSAARARVLLDALIAASSLTFLAWAGALDDLYDGAAGLQRWATLAYPVGDIVIGSLLLVAATRVRPAFRLTWWMLGSGLGFLTIGHALFAYTGLLDGFNGVGVDAAIRTAGFALIGLAGFAPGADLTPIDSEPRPGRPLAILLPYAPFLIAGTVAASRLIDGTLDTVSIYLGATLIALLLARQLLAQFENLDIHRHLDSLVQARTEELNRQERLFSTLVKNASDVLTLVDRDRIVRYQSVAAERILGYRPSELVGRPIEELLHPDDRQHFGSRVHPKAALGDVALVVHARFRHKEGRFVAMETTVANLLDSPDVDGLLLTSRDVSERKELEDQLRHRAFHDPLTGLGNRTLFHDRLGHAAARASRNPEELAVLLLDLDGFKEVNDTLGHAAGDLLLQTVAERLSSSVRPGDTVARMGGDEFAILIEDAAPEVPTTVAERVLARLKAPIDIDGKHIVPNGSIGVAMGTASRLSAEELLRAADLAMYAAKNAGRGRYEIFQTSMQQAALMRVELEAELRKAIRENELCLHYQPIVELPSGRISGVEALVRWLHPTKGMIPPVEFIPLAEESDLVVDLGRWVLNQACRDLSDWQEIISGDAFSVSVNVAARQLASPWLLKEVRSALERFGLPATSLVLEITEGALMSDTASIQPTLHALRDLGVTLAIDDFGTGWSSLSRLRSFPVDKLKIDRAFVSEIRSADDEAPVVAAVLGMAHSLELDVVAEGVETLEQLVALDAMGCDAIQGYLLSRPVPADAIVDILSEPSGLLASGGSRREHPSDGELMGVVAQAAQAGAGDQAGDPVIIQSMLDQLQHTTGLDSVWVTEIDRESGVQRVLAAVNAGELEVRPGSVGRLEGTLAADVVADASRGRRVPGRVCAPIVDATGTVWGTLEAASESEAIPEESALVLLELFTMILAEHLAATPLALA